MGKCLGVFDLIFIIVFFFKQKTAYEMRISDWSSDVCSSDLHAPFDPSPKSTTFCPFVDRRANVVRATAALRPFLLKKPLFAVGSGADSVFADKVEIGR